ncbi:hypothetical protein H5410_027711 [Solanum commersonii]|uniref:Uncharacterized protein n=1 Tax=Solanum commersonii TaxID=4109 RepID=A0A9J5YZY1_SOLCO|nr:hypothetical protein H5410_027711 [Solanum commersonii]
MHSAIRPLVYFVALHHLPSASFCPGSMGDVVMLRGVARRYADCSFSPLICSIPSGLSTLEQKVNIVQLVIRRMGSAIRRSSFLRSFIFFCSFLLDSVHVFPQTSNT